MSRWVSDPVWGFKTVVGQLTKLGVVLPDPVAAQYELFNAITVPAEADPNELTQAIAGGEHTDKQIDALVLDQVKRPALRAATAAAKTVAAKRGMVLIKKHAPEIHAQLDKGAAPLIDKWHATAQAGGTSLDSLIRAGRNDEARLVADAHLTWAALSEHYEARNAVWQVHESLLNGVDTAQYHDRPTAVNSVAVSRIKSDAGRAHDLYARGARWWFPTPSQWHTRAEELAPKPTVGKSDSSVERDRRASFAG